MPVCCPEMEEQAGFLEQQRQHSWCRRYSLALMHGFGAYILRLHCISIYFHASKCYKPKNSRKCHFCGNHCLQLHRPCNDMGGSRQDSESLVAWLQAEGSDAGSESSTSGSNLPSQPKYLTLIYIDANQSMHWSMTPILNHLKQLRFAPSIKAST